MVVMVCGGVFALFWAVNTARPLVPALVKGIHLFGFENYLKLNSIKKNYFRIVLDIQKSWEDSMESFHMLHVQYLLSLTSYEVGQLSL